MERGRNWFRIMSQGGVCISAVEPMLPEICQFCTSYLFRSHFSSRHTVLVIGVMNAADYYGLDELRRACAGFVQCCINVDTVCALLASAERYIQYKCTKSLVQKVTNNCS